MKALLFPIFAAILLGSAPVAWAQSSLALANDIRKNVARLAGSEAEASAALERLKLMPRARVLEVVREDLRAYVVPEIACLRAVMQLELRELEPDLRGLAVKTESWTVLQALNSFGPSEEINKIYLSRLGGFAPSPVKVAMLGGLSQTALSPELFNTLINESALEVRVAAWTHFLQTAPKLPVDEQVRRLKLGFSVKPYPVRVSAFENHGRFPAAVRAKTKLPKCQDLNAKVRAACLQARGGAT